MGPPHDKRLPSGLDLVEYQARAYGIRDGDVQAALQIPQFRAAVLTYGRGLIPLGYATFFAWPKVSTILPHLSPERVRDIVRYCTARTRLDSSDPQHIAIDNVNIRAEFPALFTRNDRKKAGKAHDEFMAEMAAFLVSDPLRSKYRTTLTREEDAEYAAYWLKSSDERVASLLSDRRFLVGLDAYHDGALSYGGLVHKLYGDADYVLFPEIGWNLSALIVSQMAKAIDRGEISIPPGLRAEFPDLYKFYNPEAFGPGE